MDFVKESLTYAFCQGILDTMEKSVAAQAETLRKMIASKLGDLADEYLGRPEWGTPEWLEATKALQNDKRARQDWYREWHLAKIEIAREADIDPIGDVLNARKNGATWQDIGTACGFTRQRAQERWGKLENLPGRVV